MALEDSRGEQERRAIVGLRVTTCAPSQVQPLVLYKSIRRARLKMENRKGRFIQCSHIGKKNGVPRKLLKSMFEL